MTRPAAAAPMVRGEGRLVVVSAPSGAGKTSLVRALLADVPEVRFSTSYTTRPPRRGEVEGVDYFFVSPEKFEAMADRGEFLEHALVFGNRYGTSRTQVAALTGAGCHVLLEIDWQGARQVRMAEPESVSVFIMPPSLAELERRLRGRSTDTEATIQKRLGEARDEMTHWDEFDYAVVNDRFDEALGELRNIILGHGERNRTDNPECRRRIQAVMA
jgi:guanylate kinase